MGTGSRMPHARKGAGPGHSRVPVRARKEFMAQVSLAHSYPELFRVTGPLSIVLRTEDMWQRYNQCIEAGGALNQGFP